jgi:hypothetical protein
MTTTVASDLEPDRSQSEQWPALDRDPAQPTSEEPAAHFPDVTQGRRIGSRPYDDLTQGRKVGSAPYDDLTQGRKVGSAPHDDLTQGRRIGSDPYDDLTQGARSAPIPTTTSQGLAGHRPVVYI